MAKIRTSSVYLIVDLIYSFSEHLLSVHYVIDVALGNGGIPD